MAPSASTSSKLWSVVVFGWLCGCGPAHNLKLPAGITCAKTVSAGPAVSSLIDALARATPGTCVVAAPAQYAVSLVVPAGVTLAADVGTPVEVTGDPANEVAITMGAGATLSGVQVRSRSGIGVSLLGGGTQLIALEVRGASRAGVVAWCEDDCLVADLSVLNDVVLVGNAVGLLVHGARVSLVGGRVAESESSALGAGYGVVASSGADLTLEGTVIETNQELGVLIDGAAGTTATLSRITVRDNRGRGVWAQSLAGTALAPKLRMTDCTVEGNRLAGVGARGSRGLVLQGGRVTTTAIGRTTGTQAGMLVDVGDGVGLFDGTGEVLVDSVTLTDNGRSQVLVDQGATGLRVQGGAITPSAGQLGVVVQRTVPVVDAPMIFVPSAGSELPLSIPSFPVPVR